MHGSREILVKAIWDDEAKVWSAEGINHPGIVTEAPTFEGLVKKLCIIIPEILEENDIPFKLLGELSAITNSERHCA
jgi:hypothetical protein